MEWPTIKPKYKLEANYLKGNDLITVPNFFTSSESKAFIKVAESLGFVHQGSLGPAKGEAYRDNDRISVNDLDLANSIWEAGLSKLFKDIKFRGKVAVGLNPNIRFYRYKAGQRFGRHIDESVDLGDGKHTHYTLLIYLSGSPQSKGKGDLKSTGNADPLVGGETVFYGSRNSLVAEVAPAEGMALVHIHGDKCMLHEARNVTKGVNHGRTFEEDEQGLLDRIWKHCEPFVLQYTQPVDMFDRSSEHQVLKTQKLQRKEEQRRRFWFLEQPF